MTIVVVVLLGIGVVLIASSLECQPITATFQHIINNQKIDWSGQAQCASTGTADSLTTPTSTGSIGAAIQGVIKLKDCVLSNGFNCNGCNGFILAICNLPVHFGYSDSLCNNCKECYSATGPCKPTGGNK